MVILFSLLFSSSGLDRFLSPSFPVYLFSRGAAGLRSAGATRRTSTVAGTIGKVGYFSKLQCIMDTCTHFTRSQSSYNSIVYH